MTPRVRVYLALLLALAASGCATWGGKLPALELYRLSLPADTAFLAASDGNSGAGAAGALGPLVAGGVAIVPYSAPGVYGQRSIVYRIGDTEYGAYPYREWAVPLPTMLGLVTQDVLHARPVSAEAAVFDPPSRRSYAYMWRGLVRELEEVDRGTQVVAAVALEARLVRTRDDSVVWSGMARLERPVPEGSMPAIVAALSRLSTEVVARLADEARAALARSAGSAGPRRD